MKKIYFICFTPFHLISSMYYASKISDIRNYQRVLIWINYFDYGIKLEMIDPFFEKIIEIPYYDNVNKIRKQFFKFYYSGYAFKFNPIGNDMRDVDSKSIILCFSDVNETTHRAIEIIAQKGGKIILVEEGLGTYLSHNNKESIKTFLIRTVLGMHTEKSIGSFRAISSVFLQHPEWNKKYKKEIVIQQNNIFRDAQFLDQLYFVKNEIKTIKSKNKKSVLWLGDPVDEIGGKKEDELNIIKFLSNKLSDEYQIFIKPHPREDIYIYNSILSDNIKLLVIKNIEWMPAEIVSSYLDFKTIITSASSAAINIYELKKNCQVIYLYKLIKGIYEISDKALKPILSNKNVWVPDSEDQIIDLIKGEDNIETINVTTEQLNCDIRYLREVMVKNE